MKQHFKISLFKKFLVSTFRKERKAIIVKILAILFFGLDYYQKINYNHAGEKKYD